MNIDPTKLYEIAVIAPMMDLSVSQVHQAKYNNELIVRHIGKAHEQVFGDDAIQFMKTKKYASKKKQGTKISICDGVDIVDNDQPSSELSMWEDDNIDTSHLETFKNVCGTMEPKEGGIHFHVHNHYYGKVRI